jgi:drug/metabolite transporter (DMT)-like permease
VRQADHERGAATAELVVATPALLAAPWAALPAAGWGAVLYSGLGALVIAYLFWYRGVRVLGPTRASMYGNLQPVIAIFVAWLTLGETPTPFQGVGAVLILSGLFLTRSSQ